MFNNYFCMNYIKLQQKKAIADKQLLKPMLKLINVS